jgi:Zn-dependent peptidase ImmA (M78 family)
MSATEYGRRARAELLANQLRDAVHAVSTSRVHLHAVARYLDVESIRVGQLAVDGQVDWNGQRPAIFIRDDMTETRRRFTLAHELAHIALGHAGVQNRCSVTQQDEDERLCDSVAAALLMPAKGVADWLSSHALTVDSLTEFADELGVSRGALVRRVREVTGSPCILLTFSAIKHNWVASANVYGRTPQGAPDRRPWLSREADRLLHNLPPGPATDVRLLMRFGTRAFDCGCSAMRVGESRIPRVDVLVTDLMRVRHRDARGGSRTHVSG